MQAYSRRENNHFNTLIASSITHNQRCFQKVIKLMSGWGAMNTSVINKREVKRYFTLKERINEKKECLEEMRDFFYNQTMSSVMKSDGLDYRSKAFNIEKNVCDLVDTMASKEKVIEEMEHRNRFFRRYLNTLTPGEQTELKKRYTDTNLHHETDSLDEQAYEEIEEIEEAINFIYGYPVNKRTDHLSNIESVKSSIKNTKEMLGI